MGGLFSATDGPADGPCGRKPDDNPRAPRKVIIVGAHRSGKSSFYRAARGLPFGDEHQVQAAYHELQWGTPGGGGPVLRLQLWDTAGRERFQSLAPIYYRDARAVVVAVDLSSKASLADAQRLAWEARATLPATEAGMLLLGLRADVLPREVPESEARALADFMGADEYAECSAKTGAGVEAAMAAVARVARVRCAG